MTDGTGFQTLAASRANGQAKSGMTRMEVRFWTLPE